MNKNNHNFICGYSGIDLYEVISFFKACLLLI